ncbi:DUF4365 domain-containing protein [Desulfofalx alkaliphila]|uniref:DUF4365 domain-containing protein n=1 Tax=Desulfofalx alkaliphila TaxID=105483 RepID=UPI00068B47B1|nr:DUF4365 domain-containing protein [Desulfofalx alkaliphila]
MTCRIVDYADQMTGEPSGNAQLTSTLAHRIFLGALPNSWVPREKCPDYAIDYNIEIMKNNKSTGVFFGVNVKGTKKPSYGRDYLSIPMETNLLSYYYHEVKIPVFLIVVDVTRKAAFWLLTQEYVYKILEKTNPGWREQKTISLNIHLSNKLDKSGERFENAVISGMEFLYLQQFQLPYKEVTERIEKFYNSEAMDLAVKKERERQFGIKTTSYSCSQSICQEEYDTIDKQADFEIKASLIIAENLSIKDPKENREAYYHLSDALAIAGHRANPRIRYIAMGERYYHDYIYHLMNFFNINPDMSVNQLHLRYHTYFVAMGELIETIYSALDEEELVAASMLLVRLADIYFSAFPFICTALGHNKAFPLLDSAQELLELAHNLTSAVENPGAILQ